MPCGSPIYDLVLEYLAKSREKKTHNWQKGKRGGTFYLTPDGKKVYKADDAGSLSTPSSKPTALTPHKAEQPKTAHAIRQERMPTASKQAEQVHADFLKLEPEIQGEYEASIKEYDSLRKVIDSKNATQKDYDAYAAASSKMLKLKRNLAEKARQKLIETMKPHLDQPANFKIDKNKLPNVNEHEQKMLDDAESFVNSITNFPNAPSYSVKLSENNRAYYDPSSKEVAVDGVFVTAGRYGDPELFGQEAIAIQVHELGHHIEHNKPFLIFAGKSFLMDRANGERPRPMGKGYERDEKGVKDDFEKTFGKAARYVGKEYGTFEGTEIISMGLEKLYTDPVGFAKNDPQYFKFLMRELLV